jgi:hypothetical protein
MENAESSDLVSETLRKQFKLVRERTSANRTYLQVRPCRRMRSACMAVLAVLAPCRACAEATWCALARR